MIVFDECIGLFSATVDFARDIGYGPKEPIDNYEEDCAMSFRRLQWLFPIAVTVHNSEEAIFMPVWVLRHRNQVPLHPSEGSNPGWLLFLTLAAFSVTALSARGGKQSV